VACLHVLAICGVCRNGLTAQGNARLHPWSVGQLRNKNHTHDCMLWLLKELVHGANVWDAGLSGTKIHMRVYSEDNKLLQAVTQVHLAQALYICMPLTSKNRKAWRTHRNFVYSR
jgi:hypothetical protein